MQLPSSEKSYMPTLVNGSDVNMADAKMVEKADVATIMAKKDTWPVTVQKIDRHPEDENVIIKVEHTETRSESRQQGTVSIPLQEQRKAYNGLENNSEDLVADVLKKS